MPLITATPLPAYGWVRLALDWTDQAGVAFARVERVEVVSGLVTPVRPHTYYSGWYQALSGGRALMYDTEAPVDVAFYYRTASLDEPDVTYASPDQAAGQGVIRDDFTRTVAAGATWGTATSGHVWASISTTTQASVSSGVGRIAFATRTTLGQVITGAARSEVDVAGTFTVSATPTGDGVQTYFTLRRVDASNFYTVGLVWYTTGQLGLSATRTVAGASTNLATVFPGIAFTAGTGYRMRAQVLGSTIRARVWLASGPEPAGWQLVHTDYSVVGPGPLRYTAFLSGTNTNTLPYTVTLDDLVAYSYDPGSAQPVTLTSGGGFWLRSPMHPAKDHRVVLCPPDTCPPTAGTFFASMDEEVHATGGSTLMPVNGSLGIGVARRRRAPSSTLTLVTRTFADRDALLDTLSDGTQLQWVAPPEYGIPARYVGVGDVPVSRGMSDHRVQPRLFSLPFVTQRQAAGPSTGALGARHRDLCATHLTWAAVAAAGQTYAAMMTVS